MKTIIELIKEAQELISKAREAESKQDAILGIGNGAWAQAYNKVMNEIKPVIENEYGIAEGCSGFNDFIMELEMYVGYISKQSKYLNYTAAKVEACHTEDELQDMLSRAWAGPNSTMPVPHSSLHELAIADFVDAARDCGEPGLIFYESPITSVNPTDGLVSLDVDGQDIAAVNSWESLRETIHEERDLPLVWVTDLAEFLATLAQDRKDLLELHPNLKISDKVTDIRKMAAIPGDFTVNPKTGVTTVLVYGTGGGFGAKKDAN